MRVSLFEIFLIQVILYVVLWLLNDYIATYMSIVIPGLCLAVLTVALLSELIEPARISKKYYWFMGISIVTPLMVGIFFYTLNQGQFKWLEGI
jgi:putative effector of murein hydrolase LrgA (UPF0299 family)